MKSFPYTAFFLTLLIHLNSCTSNIETQISDDSTKDEYCVACYYLPIYHQDPRNVRKYGFGWTGWELVKNATPCLEENQKPKIPLWGYTDDSNPRHMEQKIDAAADHGIDVFIFDWFYHNHRPFLQGAVEQGFFNARNRNRLKFALMWVNNNMIDVFPTMGESVLLDEGSEPLDNKIINAQTWDEMTNYIINTYFKHSGYWTIDNAPYFSIYNLSMFLQSFESIEKAKLALEKFREKTRNAGFSNIHLNVVQWGDNILPSGKKLEDDEWMELIGELGFTSSTSYTWIHHAELEYPVQGYNELKNEYLAYAEQFVKENTLQYFPNIIMGWDCRPRKNKDEKNGTLNYPFTGIVNDNTPEKFKFALEDIKQFLNTHPSCNNTVIINCWNDWIDGSYMEPDTINKMAYLEALKRVY